MRRLLLGVISCIFVLSGCDTQQRTVSNDATIEARVVAAVFATMTAVVEDERGNGTPVPQGVESAGGYLFNVASSANLRGGPGTNYPIVGGLKVSEQFKIVSRIDDGSWFEIETGDGQRAWLAEFLVANPPSSFEDIPVAADVPTPPAVVQRPPSSQRLQVEFVNPHYNCDRGNTKPDDFYRRFQIDFFMENTTSERIDPQCSRIQQGGLPPLRWIIIGEGQTRVEEESYSPFCWQGGFEPGESKINTFWLWRVEMWEWVQAVEWEYQGHVYRQEFVDNALNRAEYHYVGCPLREWGIP